MVFQHVLHLRIVVETPSVCFRQSLLSCSNLRQRQTLLEEVHPLWLQPAHQTGHSGDHSLQVTDWMCMNTHGSARTHNSLTHSYSCGFGGFNQKHLFFLFLTSFYSIMLNCLIYNVFYSVEFLYIYIVCIIKSIFLPRSCSDMCLKYLRSIFAEKQQQEISDFCHIDEKFFLCF